MRLAGKTALITGATSGIGEATAILSEEGAGVAVIGRDADRGQAVEEKIRSNGAMARMATPDEVARAVLFLASEESSFITGAALPVDGGGVAGY